MGSFPCTMPYRTRRRVTSYSGCFMRILRRLAERWPPHAAKDKAVAEAAKMRKSAEPAEVAEAAEAAEAIGNGAAVAGPFTAPRSVTSSRGADDGSLLSSTSEINPFIPAPRAAAAAHVAPSSMSVQGLIVANSVAPAAALICHAVTA